MLRAVLQSARPHQWVKNTFVLAPLVFSQSLSDLHRVGVALLATAFFCMASSGVYLVNDLFDRHTDRRHPVKRRRPIASGELSLRAARAFAAGLLLGAILGGTALDWLFALLLSGYIAVNIAYSRILKHIAFIDVSVVALGFLLRVVSGAVVIDVPISIWLVVCTFLLSLYLALGKRCHELMAEETGGSTRPVLDQYRLQHVKLAMGLLAVVTTVCYGAYTFDPLTRHQFHTDLLPITIPLIAVGLWRFYDLVRRGGEGHSPTERMVRDPFFLANVVLWGVVILALIY